MKNTIIFIVFFERKGNRVFSLQFLFLQIVNLSF